MPDEPQRLILKPAQATPDQWAQLREALGEAVSVQNRLAAKSPYILRFTAPVREEDGTFVIPHEPATSWRPDELFAPDGPPAPYDQLLTTSAALLDALAAAHAPAGGARPTVHGGLCPGVLLTGEDGLTKITDFGFAPAVCKVLGVEAYLNLAAGPRAAASGAWEVVAADVIDRDDRLCAFIDPDKYGQGTLTTFEAGSDTIAAGFILRLLAEHRHPYLFYEPDAHRVVDMAQMMSFGVPVPVAREDLSRNERSDVRAWCELVAAMVARLPSERPPVTELIRRLKSFAPQAADVSVLKARRWLVQLETLRDAGAWRELEAALKDRPAVEEWPADLLARADALEQQVRDRLAEAARQAAIEEQHRTAKKWFERLRSAVQDAQWDAARKLLGARPALEHWPESVQRDLEPLTAQVTAGLARQEAREWQSDLEADFKANDWAAVGRRLATRPPEQHWPPEVRDAVQVIETAYRKHLDAQERERRRIASQHAEVRGWLERARGLANQNQWVAGLDLLEAPPKVEHWPPETREEAERLAEVCRAQLGDKVAANLEAINAALRRLATAAVEAVVQERLAGLLRPAQVDIVVENVIWGAEEGDDGHAPVRASWHGAGDVVPPATRRRTPGEPRPHGRGPDQAPEPTSIHGELYFRLRGDEPQLTRGITEWREALVTGLRTEVGRLQEARLAAFEHECRASLFHQASVAASLKPPQQQADARLALLGPGDNEGALAVALRWNDAALCWEPADPDRCRDQAVAVAGTVSRRAAWATLLAASPLLRTYEPLVAFEFTAQPPKAGSVWPRSVAFDAKVTVRLGEAEADETLAAGRITCERAGQAALDADFQQIETRLTRLVVRAQEESRKRWESRLKEALSDAPVKAKLIAPGRIKAPVGDLTFEIRPKSGDSVAVKGPWDTRRLAFDLAGWEAAVQTLAAPPPAVAEPPPAPNVAQPPPAPKVAQPPPAPNVAQPPPAERAPPRAAVPQMADRSRPDVAQPPPAPKVAQPPPAERPPPRAAVPPAPSASPPVTSGLRRPKGVIYGVGTASVVVVAVVLYFVVGVPNTSVVDKPPQPVVVTPPPQPDPSPISNGGSAVTPDDVGGTGPATTEPEVAPQPVVHHPEEVPLPPPPVVVTPPPQPDTPPGPSREELAATVSQVAARVAEHLDGGELRAAHEAAAAAADAVGQLEGTLEVQRLRDLLAEFPRPWGEVESELAQRGYTAGGEFDPATGYPAGLRDAAGHELVLVSLGPRDALWGKLTDLGGRIRSDHPLVHAIRQPVERGWRLFYVDADEFPADTPQSAAAEAARRGRRLPTRDEWFLAALRLRTDDAARALFGGLWEWCGTEEEGYWLCGGSQVLMDRQAAQLRRPSAADELGTWWTWLTHPLVMQRRSAAFGDKLTGARSILSVYPPL